MSAQRGLVLVALTVLVALLVVIRSGPERIEEDDPRWDCRTMGNHTCGPATTADAAVQS